MRIKQFAAIASAISAIGVVAAPAASADPPNHNAARAVCAAAGDTNFIDEGAAGYACLGVPDPTQGQFASGQAVCEHAYRGTFMERPSGYICILT
jgi:opacity protein-like surface antigen